ncbi:unnamed protein product [Polarella glacialis]|uniref:Carbohydrate-binding domain-containing protein n=1 Tax=Polarella glacialis TaxID=89957 RepID=A0A813FJ79_POLGL|nr:unnamed protein product [Polarella glacialis]CAE8703989.1 unnamed protein product [Polarella glacialis]
MVSRMLRLLASAALFSWIEPRSATQIGFPQAGPDDTQVFQQLKESEGWQFLDAYPAQYVARRLGQEQRIVIDGILDDAAWSEVPFTGSAWMDIAQPLFPDFVLPAEYSTRVKVRWDADFLYVGAELGEPYVTGVVTGHNQNLSSPNPIGAVPYYDNDFEIFIDVSGTNHYYKEFEMNYRNATYDVFWRVPDDAAGLNSVGVPCCSDGTCPRWCVNTSFPGYAGSWTMSPRMRTATGKTEHGWAVEIALPLRATGQSGGLLDGGKDWDRFDPGLGAKFWYMDFARAEHPFFTAQATLFAPLCSQIKETQPTLLGTDQWSCYFEYVWQSCGGHRYMHNPDTWGFLQFAAAHESAECRNVEWPARYLLSQLYQAEVAYFQVYGRFSEDIRQLSQPSLCRAEIGCSSASLVLALTSFSDIYEIDIVADNNATRCVLYAWNGSSSSPDGGPCFSVSVNVKPPGRDLQIFGTVSEERYLNVTVAGSEAEPCLV